VLSIIPDRTLLLFVISTAAESVLSVLYILQIYEFSPRYSVGVLPSSLLKMRLK